MERYGFIGMGNMATAICRGMIQSGKVLAESIFAYAPNQEKLIANAADIGFTPCKSPDELLQKVDTVIIACKPYQIEKVLEENRNLLAGKSLVSIAAGWNWARFASLLDSSTRIQTIMPNTPVMVGAGVIIFEEENSLLPEDRVQLMDIMSATGLVVELPSKHQSIGTAIAGCGPAYVDLVIEALGDAGVKYGLSRDTSYALASQMIMGAAKLQLETGTHPAVLKDNVCSPGGSTICGVTSLEQSGLRSSFIEAIDSVMAKTL